VSPARSNLEETLSTLDYALKAKSIHNKPEVNQRMTRNSLIKEYVGEIERLKADILAAREKNGIYFSEETWNQLAAEQEIRKTDLEEAKKHVEIVEGQIRVIRGEYEESIGRLKLTEKELSSTQQRLQETEYTLNLREIELEKVQMALEEEIFVRQAHQNTEAKLDGVASELKTAVHASLQDVGNLHDKLGECVPGCLFFCILKEDLSSQRRRSGFERVCCSQSWHQLVSVNAENDYTVGGVPFKLFENPRESLE